MNLSAVDLNLLVAFEALYDTRNVTLAGQRINRAQPSVSSALGRLRLLFPVSYTHLTLPTILLV